MESPRDLVESKYPNHQKLFYMLPGPPDCFKNDPLFNHALGNQTVAEFIRSVQIWIGKMAGGFQINQLKYEEKSSDKDDPSKEMIDCCLYIPNLAFKAIIVFKYIHFVREDTLENTLGSVISQLDAIESILSASSSCKPDSVKLKLTIFIVLCGALSEFRPQKKEKLPKEKEMDCLVEELNDQIVGKSQKYRYLEVGLLRVAKPKSNEPFDEYEKGKLKTFFTNLNDERHKTHDDVENLMSEIVISAPQLKTLEVIQKQLSFQINPAEHISLDNEGLKKFRDLYFNGWKQKIVTIPDFDRIKSGLLYVTEHNDGRLNETKCNEFIGEMQNFWKDFITQLDSPSGLLMKSFTNTHLSSLLQNDYKEKFEIDWLYCSEKDIIAIEIGRTIKLEKPVSAVSNKIHQCLYTLIPKMQYVIWYLLEHVEKTCGSTECCENEEELQAKKVKFLQNHFKVILYFPNINAHRLETCLKTAWGELKQFLLLNIPDLTWKHIYFLVPSDPKFVTSSDAPTTSNNLPSLFKLEASFSSRASTTSSEPAGQKRIMSLRLLDSSFLKSLFGGEKSARGHSETPSSTVENSDRTSNVAALLALSFFVNEKLEIEEFAKLPLTTDEKFLDDQQKFIKKESESQFLFLKQLNITLSPQQHQILTQNKKLLLLVGEPGAGKTVLLLAKAFVAAKDPSVESIFYYAPAVKTALKEDVLKFVQYPEYEELFSKKFKYLSDKELFNLENKSFKNLQETVLLIDEIYFEAYDERKQKHGANFSQNFFQLSQKVFPYLRNCWMANIVASGLSEDFEIMSKFFNHQFFSIQPLSVQYRSSSHIGTFSTNYLHQSRQIGWSSVRVPGSFMSSQTEVSIRIYDHRDSLDNSAFDDNLNYDRWAIVFCEAFEVSAWECKVRKSGKFSRIFVVSSSVGCHECQFSGGESISVAIYVDHISPEDPEQIFPVLNLAITRAQSHLTIHVRKEFYPRMENFFQLRDQNEKQVVLMDARAGLPIDFSKISSEKMPELVDKLYAVAFAKSDRKLFIELEDQFKHHKPAAKLLVQNMNGWKEKKFLENLTGKNEIIREFWEKELQTLENSNQTCSLLGTIIHAIDISCIALLEWIFNLMGGKNIKRLLCQFPPTLLFQSCFKGSRPIMEYILKQLKKFDMVQREMECIYSVWGEETTLLTLLCYGNQTVDVVKLILNRGFPDQLLLHSFLGKNALQFAMEHNNVETVKCLLARKNTSTKKSILLMPSMKLCGISPVEYAQQIGFEEIVDCVSKF